MTAVAHRPLPFKFDFCDIRPYIVSPFLPQGMVNPVFATGVLHHLQEGFPGNAPGTHGSKRLNLMNSEDLSVCTVRSLRRISMQH